MIAWSHHNIHRLRRERRQQVVQYLTVLGAALSLGFLLFF
jgi:hypothetical protein